MFFSRRPGNRFYPRGDVAPIDWDAFDLTKDDLWHELDLSGIVGAGKRLVFIRCYLNETAGGKSIKLRTAGNVNTFNVAACYTQVANKTCDHTLSIYTDAAGKIEYFVNTATWNALTLTIRGWFK